MESCEIAPRISEEQLIQYQTQGFLHLPKVIDAHTLARLQQAFDAATEKHSDHWREDRKVAYFDIPSILDEDDVFVDLVDLPVLFPILLAILGGDIQLVQTQARLFLPGPTFTPPWHSDLAGMKGINLGETLNFHLKVHFYPFDLLPDQGCLAFLPGSHRYSETFQRPSISPDPGSSAVRRVVPRAGDAVMFNTHLLHMALDNNTCEIRRSLIYSYSHFWVKNSTSAIPRDWKRLATTAQRLQLFGQPSPGAAPPFFQTCLGPDLGPDIREFFSAGQKLLSRSYHACSSKLRRIL
jgi:phytanoyl-CoA hydroxylase